MGQVVGLDRVPQKEASKESMGSVKGQLWVKKEMKCGSGICQKSLENGENQEIFTVFWSY